MSWLMAFHAQKREEQNALAEYMVKSATSDVYVKTDVGTEKRLEVNIWFAQK